MKNQTKDKKRTSTDYAVAVIFVLAITAIIYIAFMLFTEKLEETSYAITGTYENNEDLNQNVDENSNYNNLINNPIQETEVSINEIIEKNAKNILKEEIIKEEIDLEYTTKYVDNPDLPKGMLQVLQEGINGTQEIYIKKTYEGEELVKEEQTGSKFIKYPVNKIVEVGTGSYTSNYKAKVGDTLYVTTNLLTVRIEPDNQATKLISLSKNAEVKLLQIKEDWYQIQYQSYIGWSKAECLTYLAPNSEVIDGSGSQYTKQQLLSKLNFNMKLNEPSELSLEQFKKIFNNESKDTNKIFYNNAQYFYYAEKQYNINGVFLAAVAIHESGWGSSTISVNKNNLFGYGAYDSSPYESSYQFSDYSEGIDLLARVFVKYYLNPAGTKIYNDNVATGTYYNGATVSGVNKKYATDNNWANGVYTWMQYLYNRL